MSVLEESLATQKEFENIFNVDLTNSCRVCKCEANKENKIKLRPLFKGSRITRLIANTIHIEIEDNPGLPRFLCEKCFNTIKTFSTFQLGFRRSEEDFKKVMEVRKNHDMITLHAFAAAIEMEKNAETDQNAATAVNNLLKESKKVPKAKPKARN